VDHQPVQTRELVEEPGQDAVPEEGGDLVEVARRVEPLDRDVVDVVGPLARRPRPFQDCPAAGVADLLLVLVEDLVRRLLPEEGQVARRRIQEPIPVRQPAAKCRACGMREECGQRAG